MSLRQIIRRGKKVFMSGIALFNHAPNETSIILSKDEVSSARFCFLGEFGYEMISWIPYLLFLKENVGIQIRTIGRPGSSIFYYFSDEHIELDASYVGDVWGDPASYARVAKLFKDDILIFPGKDAVNRKNIAIGGYEWSNKNIHKRIDQRNYSKPDYSFITAPSLIPNKQIVVINNKYLRQWPDTYEHPINYFDRPALESLKKILITKGYGVIYNHFIELTSHDEYFALDDKDIFGTDENTYDMRKSYTTCTNVSERNRMQLSLYNASNYIIGPQGGNLYLPSVCQRPLYILMRAGDYLDYLELGRLYGINVEVFYEPKHMICWIEKMIPNAGSRKKEEMD